MTGCLGIALVTAAVCTPAAAEPAVLENDALRLTLDTDTGLFSVLDKQAKARWTPFSKEHQVRKQKPQALLRIRQAPAAVVVDGDLAEWKGMAPIRISSRMVAHAKTVTGDKDLSAKVYVMWDSKALFVAAEVTDDKPVFGDTDAAGADRLKWWYRDSVEFWVGGVQVGLALNPAKSLAVASGRELTDAQVATRRTATGYTVEARIPLRHIPSLASKARVGGRCVFAVGVNDADATGSREGQIYFPGTWTHSEPETFADAVLADARARVSDAQMQRAAGRKWAGVRHLKRLDRPHPGLSFETELNASRGMMPATVRIWLPKGGRDVRVEIEAPKETKISSVAYPAALVAEAGECWVVPSLYNDGMLFPLRVNGMPRRYGGQDTACFGVTDVDKGHGYLCIFDTPDDARMSFSTMGRAKDARLAAGVRWHARMGVWGETRKAIYRFCATGRHVALAKAYRQYAQEKGFFKTLREKMKRRPHVARLAGAPNIWGAPGLTFCREAKAAGVDRLLVNGSFGVEATKAMIELGYLVSTYDNYEDIMAGKPGRYGDCTIPDDAPLKANGKRQLGWPVWERDPKTGKTKVDPKTGKPVVKAQFYKRCSALQLPVAKRWIRPDQEKNPRNARFLDVTTATGLRECYDPKHYCTRNDDRKHKARLGAYVGDELGLVLGGEHGKWWGVPHFDYWEGMQSGGFYSWPAGHVGADLPKTREDIGKSYLTYGIGHAYRIPFWELAFGDCVVSYWYWGDSTGHLYEAAPEISYKKDLFNMLYANPPMYWVNRPYSFHWRKPELRERLLESYRNTCKLHEQIAFDEMLDHMWLTDDRTVQKTTFSSGTFVVANFDEKKTFALTDAGKTHTLAPLGFYARGPKVLQYRVVADGRTVTFIRTPGYLFADGGGKRHDFGAVATAGPLTVRTIQPDVLHVRPGKADAPALVRPADLVKGWDLASTQAIELDTLGQRVKQAAFERVGDAVSLTSAGAVELVAGPRHELPCLTVSDAGLSCTPSEPKQGQPLTLALTVANTGRTPAKGVPVVFYLGSRSAKAEVGRRQVDVAPGGAAKVQCTLQTAGLDGPRTLIAVVDPDNTVAELIERDRQVARDVVIAPDWSKWHGRIGAEVVNGPFAQQDTPVALDVDFGPALKRLGADAALDTGSVRVSEVGADGEPACSLPCQFEPAKGFDAKTNAKGAVVWVAAGTLAPKAAKRYLILFDSQANGPKTADRARIWDAADTTASTAAYRVVFREGCIAGLYGKLGAVTDKPFLKGLIYSSGKTGWTREEDGKVLALDVLANGPVRAKVRVRKQLKGGLVYEKTYTFHPRRFDLHVKANKSYGALSRAYVGLVGTYEDMRGQKAMVDGNGNAEGVSGKCPRPTHYSVYAPGWAYSCVATSPFANMTYWDGHAWGGIALSGGRISGATMSYVIHPGQADGRFAKRDHQRLTNPPTVRLAMRAQEK